MTVPAECSCTPDCRRECGRVVTANLPRVTGPPSSRARRDRHGRGLRGPLAPPTVPISRLAAETFDDTVLRAIERLERLWPPGIGPMDLATIQLVVAEIPPPPLLAGAEHELLPLGRVEHGPPPSLVIFRRPVELRSANSDELAALVREVLAELVAELFGMPPGAVDPDYY